MLIAVFVEGLSDVLSALWHIERELLSGISTLQHEHKQCEHKYYSFHCSLLLSILKKSLINIKSFHRFEAESILCEFVNERFTVNQVYLLLART